MAASVAATAAAAHKPSPVEDWLHAHARAPDEIDLGLARVAAVRDALGLRLSAPVVTVGGTNGKGSVCALASSILAAAGYRAGCYTSPHILTFGERIQINQQAVAEDEILAALKRTAAVASQLNIALTYFELTTLAAVEILQTCEVVVLEVGLGGRLDAVNIFEPTVAVITNVENDHAEFLGNTREAIAGEKAGIARAGVPLVIGEKRAAAVLRPHLPRGCRAIVVGGTQVFAKRNAQTWDYHSTARNLKQLPHPALRGAHQIGNAAVAVAALECLPPAFWPGSGGVRRGLHAARLPGRAQVLAGRPAVVVDVAHNVAAAQQLERFLFHMGYYPQTRAVLGMMRRKDLAGFVRALQPRICHWYVATPNGGDYPAAEMGAAVAAVAGAERVSVCASIAAAAQKARAASEESDRIVVCGSFLTVADFLRATPA